jgi:hypothetical protein
VRVSLANLADECYLEVGAAIRRVFDGYVSEWQATTTVPIPAILQEEQRP